jgi:hypothetical protein
MEELLFFRTLEEHREHTLYEDAENFPFSAVLQQKNKI